MKKLLKKLNKITIGRFSGDTEIIEEIKFKDDDVDINKIPIVRCKNKISECFKNEKISK